MADESGASAGYRRRVSEARDTDTVITRAVSGRPARGLRNRLIDTLEAAGPPALGWPRQGGVSAEVRTAAVAADEADMQALWAGQAAGLARTSHPAGRIVQETVNEAVAILRRIST